MTIDWDAVIEPEGEDTGVAHFVAQYESECPCGTTIEPGDQAGYIGSDDTASCAECCGL